MIRRLNGKMIEEDRFYTVREVSGFTGYHPQTVRKHIHSGKLRSFGSTGKILLDGGEVIEYLRLHVHLMEAGEFD